MSQEVTSMTIIKKTHIEHTEHEHELELKNYQKPYKCDGCKEHGYGLRYRCELCNFDLHKECMFTFPETHHEFFKGSTFKFYNQSPGKCCMRNCDNCRRYCDACGKAINGFVYHCEAKGLDLHPCCRNLKNKICIDGEKFWLSDKVSNKCIWCKKKKLPNSAKGIPGLSYVSKSENYHFHVYCAMEMVLESWNNMPKDDNICLALENLELPLQRNSSGSSGKGRKYLRIVKMVLRTIVTILLGDPTITLACLLVELVSK
jgi:hypothetical protein